MWGSFQRQSVWKDGSFVRAQRPGQAAFPWKKLCLCALALLCAAFVFLAALGWWAAGKLVYRSAPSEKPSDAYESAQRVELRSVDGLRLSARLFSRPLADATAVLVPDWGRDGSAMQAKAEALLRANINVLLLDTRACGRSAGTAWSYGVLEQLDLLAALDGLQRKYGDDHALGIVAEGFGATAALCLAQDLRLRFIIADQPVIDRAGWLADSARSVTGAPFLSLLPLMTRARFGWGFGDADALQTLADRQARGFAAVQARVLIQYDTSDYLALEALRALAARENSGVLLAKRSAAPMAQSLRFLREAIEK